MDVFNDLKITTPIIEGGMTLVGNGHLAASVSNAGALGLIGTGKFTSAQAEEQIIIATRETSKPVGLNIMLENEHVEEIIELVGKYKIPFVTLGGGDPMPYIDKLKNFKTIIYPVVPSVAAAKRMERIGVDGVIAEGMESGGHIGSLTTISLVTQVVDNIDIPVVAAGGIASGSGILACLSLGAIGVQIGTAFAVTSESPASDAYKKKIFNARDIDTVITGSTVGESVRGIKNKFTQEFIRKEFERYSKSNISVTDVRINAKNSLYKAIVEGDLERGSFMAGQISGLIKKEITVSDLVKTLMDELNKSEEKLQLKVDRWNKL